MRLIDADALIALIKKRIKNSMIIGWLCSIIRDAPTIDAVPVVRCKYCKFGDWDSEPNDAMVCMRTKDGFWRSRNDFCSYGERKEGADNG